MELLSTFCKNFSQPATNWFVARQVWLVGGKTRNIAIRLLFAAVLQVKLYIFVARFTVP